MIRPITKYGGTVLRTRATRVTDITADVQALIDDMIETMYAAPGVGLAAPQIGVSLRIFVADPSSGRRGRDLILMINPEIVEREGVQVEPEGCLSVPDFEAPVARPTMVVVRGRDRDGTVRSVEGDGLLARVFQHEIDHLDGSLFVDHLRGLKREIILRKIKKLQRSGKW
jgi:peptide deformylase